MKRMIKCMAFVMVMIWLPLARQAAALELIPVGKVVGLELQDGSVTVEGFDDVLGEAARKAGIQKGDVIQAIDQVTVEDCEDIRRVLARSDGTVTVRLSRNGKSVDCVITPQITTDGPKLGLYLRQGVTGIGTVTYYDPEDNSFGTLGHGVSDAKGKLLNMKTGNAYDARVMTVKKGLSGEPGQLMGVVERLEPAGELTANTAQGLFGKSQTGWQGGCMEIAEKDRIHTGKATILSTVSGSTVREYSVEILKIYPQSRQTGRNLLIRVTDPALLEATGGIVQGMSGSPLVQDGKLIGAVTHVLVNDPTMGYGIFIENMLEAAG